MQGSGLDKKGDYSKKTTSGNLTQNMFRTKHVKKYESIILHLYLNRLGKARISSKDISSNSTQREGCFKKFVRDSREAKSELQGIANGSNGRQVVRL